MEPLLFKEPVRALDLGLALVVFTGIVILVPEFSLDSHITRGVLWGTLSAVFFTARNLLSRYLLGTHPSSRIMVCQFFTCGVILLPFLLTASQPVSGVSWLQILVLGIAFTALPQTLFTNALRHLTTRTVSVIATLLPIYGAISAAVLLREIPTPRTMLGGGIILTAVFLETWRAVRHGP